LILANSHGGVSMATTMQPVPGDNISTWDSLKKGIRASAIPWMLIAPPLIVMIIITFLPQAYQLFISFRDFRSEHLTAMADAPIVGINNYINILGEGLNVPNYSFFPLLGFNVAWTAINVFLHVAIGIIVALALNIEGIIGKKFYRTLYVIPWALPPYVSGLIWNNLWQQNDGGVNLIAKSFNENLGTTFSTNTGWLINTDPPLDIRPLIPWLLIIGGGLLAIWLGRRYFRLGLYDNSGKFAMDRFILTGGAFLLATLACLVTLVDVLQFGTGAESPFIKLFDRAGAPVLAFYSVLIANTWLGWPFMMTVATGALQSIPPDLYEAANVDGASKWAQFRNITLPLIRPAMVPAIMLGTIWTFNQFNVIFFITAGGPRGQTDLLVTQAYKLIQQEQLYGAAAAFSIVVFFVLLIITLINNRVTRATEAFDEA
jgi:ABC-type sugar transport system permease subunit